MLTRTHMAKKNPKSNGANFVVGLQLRSIVERIERLEEEKKTIADDIKDVYAEAKGNGFDAATIREIVKLRKIDRDVRAEREALLDIYKAALGMLDGTPLGEAAIERLTKKPEPPPDPKPPADGGPEPEPEAKEEPPAAPEPEPVDPGPTLEEAGEMGTTAAQTGKPVTSNPFPARDPRRARFDECWCAASGTDGMDIPAAWRRTPKPKKGPDPEVRP